MYLPTTLYLAMNEQDEDDELELIDSENMARVLEGFVNALALQKIRPNKLFEEKLK